MRTTNKSENWFNRLAYIGSSCIAPTTLRLRLAIRDADVTNLKFYALPEIVKEPTKVYTSKTYYIPLFGSGES